VALTDEQRAMLQLLLEGGQSYDDIGSLLGIAPDEVRTRARSALQEIGGADPDAQVGLSDYLLGQADPIGRADAVRHLQNDPEANALAQRLVQNLKLLAPKGQLPEIPEPRGGRSAPAPPPPPAAPAQTPSTPQAAQAPSAPKGPGFASRVAGVFSGIGRSSGKRRTQLVVGLAAALAVVIVVLVVATSGGSSAGSDCKGVDTSAAQRANIPQSSLSAVGAAAGQDCKPSGLVTFVPIPQQAKNGQTQLAGFAFQTNAVHLKPTSSSDAYVFWLDGGNGQARALGRETVSDDGNLTGAAPLAGTDLALLQAGTFRLALLTQAQQQQIQQALQSQGSKGTGLIPFVGTPVLEGSSSGMLQQLQATLQAAQAQAQGQAGSGAQGTGKKG